MSKQIIFFSLLFLLFVNIILSRGKNIPGIDPLPMAIDTEQPKIDSSTRSSLDEKLDQNKSLTSTTTSTQTYTSDLPDFPKIRNLKVIMDPTYPYSARITWETHPQTNTPIYIVRYSKPISTKEILLNSYNLTSPPLDPSIKSFVDKDLPEGVYYYAAVSSFELSKEGVLVLKPEVNYTINPFIIYRDSKPQEASSLIQPEDSKSQIDRKQLSPSDYEIQELSALNTEQGVVLNWKPPLIPEIKFKIYRGKEPLDSKERLQKAKLLGESTKSYFLDESPISEEPVFYGVSTYDIVLNQEFSDLKFRRSYISHTFKKPQLEYQYMDFLPDSLISYQVSKNAIQLFWVDGGSGVKFYKVYRNNEPIINEQKLENSKFLGNVQSGSIGYLDKDLEPGRYFYAVMPVISNNNELKLFYGNRTFTTYGMIISQDISAPRKEEQPQTMNKTEDSQRTYIKNISIKVEENKNVRINWDYISENSNQIKVLIYRSSTLIQKHEDLKASSEYLGEFPLVAGVYVDRNLSPGSYYYNFLEFNTQSNQIVAFYYLKKPIEIKREIIKEPEKKSVETKEENKKENTLKTEPEISKKQEPKKESEEQKQTQKTKVVSYEKELEEISKLIFTENKMNKAESKIKNLLEKQEELNVEERGRLKFYYGIVLYKQNKKEKAKKYFIDPDVQKYDSVRANFWYRRILEEL